MTDEEVEVVAREVMDAHSQWEVENNRLGGQCIWEPAHVALLARAAITALDAYRKEKVG